MKNIRISQVDTIFTNGSYPIEFLFYFRQKINCVPLRNAIRNLASPFWPLYGIYENGRIRAQEYNSDLFISETSSETMFDAARPKEELLDQFGPQNPDFKKSLFHFSVLHFKNGTVMIVRMNHLAGDGYSYFYYLSVLAGIARSSRIPFQKHMIRIFYKPRHNRTILRTNPAVAVPSIPLPEKNISRLEFIRYAKPDIAEMITRGTKPGMKQISANDVLSALVLQKTLQNNPEQFSEKISLNIPIDVRRKISDFGAKFFGNGLYFHRVVFNCSEIADLEPIQIAQKIRNSMPGISASLYSRFLENLEEQISNNQTESLVPYNPLTGCLVTNLSRLPVNKLNFGSGTPDLIITLTIAKNSAVILADKDFHVLRMVY